MRELICLWIPKDRTAVAVIIASFLLLACAVWERCSSCHIRGSRKRRAPSSAAEQDPEEGLIGLRRAQMLQGRTDMIVREHSSFAFRPSLNELRHLLGIVRAEY